jgi:serine/threonine-protein kinase
MNSPTLTGRATQLGMILGTAAYMAPEQAKGRPLDRRADIWAFGVVLYEMLSGHRGYEAEDVSETLAAVLTRDVNWSALPTSTPPRIVQLLRDCLVRDPRQRLRDIGDARLAIEKTISGAPDSSSVMLAPGAVVDRRAPASRLARLAPWAIAVLALIAAAALAPAAFRKPASSSGIVTRARQTFADPSGLLNLSRDGTKLVYITTSGTSNFMLALRQMDQFDARPIAGATDAYFPVFSPDAQWVAYATTPSGVGKLKKVQAGGGTPIVLGDGDFARGADWGDDDTIVFAGNDGLMRVSANGGTPESLTHLDKSKQESAHVRPQFLPSGKQLLFTILGRSGDTPQIAVLDLATGQYRAVAPGGDNARYVPTGHLTYGRQGALFALPFDLAQMKPTGSASPVLDAVSATGPPATADYTFSQNGLLVYAEGLAGFGTTLAWIDRKGVVKAIPGQIARRWGTGRLSPDGHRVANSITGDTSQDIWIMDLDRGVPTRLSFGGTNTFPIWKPDGSTIVYGGSPTDGKYGLYSVAADGSAPPVLVKATDKPVTPMSFTPDGKTVLYRQNDASGRSKIFVLPLDQASSAPRLLREGDAADTSAQVSPDGKWVAFASNESGASEVYLMPFPGPGGRTPVSRGGGRDPRWSRDGRDLLFVPGAATNTGVLMASVRTTPTLQVGEPTLLFNHPLGTTWDPAPDGSLLSEQLGAVGGVAAVFVTVTNWFAELNSRAPAKK